MTTIAAEPEISHHVELNQNFFLLSLADTKLVLGQFWGVNLPQRIMLSVQCNPPFTSKSRKKTLWRNTWTTKSFSRYFQVGKKCIHFFELYVTTVGYLSIIQWPLGKKSLAVLKIINLQDLILPVPIDF